MKEEISAETRLLLIEMAEGFAEGVRTNAISLSEGNARVLAQWADSLLHPEKSDKAEGANWKNITEACDLLRVTPQTFRKYVRMGKIAQGTKKRGYHEPLWQKEEIERFKAWYVSQRRKV